MAIRRDEVQRLDVSDVTTGERLANITPGEVLRTDFLAPLGLSARALARELGVPANRITEILNGERAISAETAILLGRRLGTSAEFWMNLQTAHDLEEARQHLGIAAPVRRGAAPGSPPLTPARSTRSPPGTPL